MSLNSEAWSPIEVADWIAGLGVVSNVILGEESQSGSRYKESEFATYSANFLQKNANGRLLLNLMAGDLNKYGVTNVGDQLLLHEAIQALRSELDTPRVTLQSLASTLAVRCRNYRAELSLLSLKSQNASSSSINYIPTESLTSASYLLDSSKTLIRWMTRFPFLGIQEYDKITVKITKHSFELAMLSQRDTFADNAIEEVQYLCTKLIEICEEIIHSKDSLVIQPAAVDVITLRKRTEQELGLHLESSYFGLHQVSGVKLSSPAQQSGHLEKGDEILQVNYQTVIGWPQQNVVHLLNENSNEVILTIKRRPRHAAANILAHMYLRPSNKLMGSTHRSNKRRHAAEKMQMQQNQSQHSTLTLPTAHLNMPQSGHGHHRHHHHQKSMPISPVPEDENTENSSDSTTSSSGNSPVVLLNVNVNTSPSISSSSASPGIMKDSSPKSPKQLPLAEIENKPPPTSPSPIEPEPNSPKALNSSELDSESSTKSPNSSSSANSRFWKLYPRPRNLIRRRATVTGASPTSTRPPVTFFDDEGTDTNSKLRPPLINSKSAPEKIRVGLRKQGNVTTTTSTSTSTSTDQHQQQILQHRATMPPSLDILIPGLEDSSVNFKEIGGNEEKEKSPGPGTTSNSKECSSSTVSISVSSTSDGGKPVTGEEPKSQTTTDTKCFNSNESTPPPSLPQTKEKTSSSQGSGSRSGSSSQSRPTSEEPGTNSEPRILLKGILHLRQSPSNLLVKSNSLTSTSGSGTSGTGFSPHPRWTRHPAVLTSLNSSRILQIGSDPDACLKINLGEDNNTGGGAGEVSLATEVHSRPFAFKIDTKLRPNLDEKVSSGIYYLAAESQQEFEMWIKLLMKKESIESLVRTAGVSGVRDSVYQRIRATPALYKRSISLGNSPSYSRRSSILSHISPVAVAGSIGSSNSTPPGSNVRESSSQESLNHQNQSQSHPRSNFTSSLSRKQNLLRSSRVVGSSTPNVQTVAPRPVSAPQQLAQTPLQKKISNTESVKSEWFNSPLTGTSSASNSSSSRDIFSAGSGRSLPRGSKFSSPTSTLSRDSRATTSGSGAGFGLGLGFDGRNRDRVTTTSSSNISSITIRSLVRKSDSDSSSAVPYLPLSPEEISRFKTRTASGSKLPSMGVSMVLAKHGQGQGHSPCGPSPSSAAPTHTQSAHGTPVSTPKCPKSFPTTTPTKKSSSSSTSSSSEVFIKADAEGDSSSKKKAGRRGIVNCPSCGSSTSLTHSYLMDKEKKDSATQTEADELEQLKGDSASGSAATAALDLELLRHLINEQEGSRV